MTKGWLPKQAAFEQKPEGDEDQAMRKSIPDKENSKQKCWELGISVVYLKKFKESQHVRAVPPNAATSSHMCLFKFSVKFIKTKVGKPRFHSFISHISSAR